MDAAALRFRMLGMPVTVQPAFWLVAVVLGLGGGRSVAGLALWVAVLFVSVLGHELGHAVLFRVYGHPPRIQLVAMGGNTAPLVPRPLTYGQDIVITLAGPAVGVVLGGVVLAVARSGGLVDAHPLVEGAVTDALWANFGLSVLNLVPILPLDGGRVLLAGLRLASRGRGERAALAVSSLAATAATAVALTRALWFVAALAGFLAVGSVRALSDVVRRPAHRRGEEIVAEGCRALEQRAPLAAANRAREALATQTDPELREAAGHLLLWAALLDGDLTAAAEQMASLPLGAGPVLGDSAVRVAGGQAPAIALLRRVFEAVPGDATATYLVTALLEVGRLDDALGLLVTSEARALGPDPTALVGGALFRAGRFEDAARLGERTFSSHPHPTLAYNVACCEARQGRLDDALSWLGHALDAGYDGDVGADPDLAGVRALPGYGQLRRR